MIDPKGLKETFEGGRRVVIFTHDNPDPDAIASAWLLERITSSLGLPTQCVYGGSLGRAENQTMVKLLDIPIEPFDRERIKPARDDRYALVDTQPGTGNNSFPADLRAHVVIDHHPRRAGLDADLVDVRPDNGCCTTMLLCYRQAFDLELTPALATAAFYAIVADTQDLDREASRADIEACQHLFPHVQLSLLGRLRHPPRERAYFRTIARAMRQVQVGKNTCICHIGPVSTAGVVAEVADFLVAMKQITWCLVSGLHGDTMVLSLRTTHREGNAEGLIRAVLHRSGSGGGHAMIAGGAIPCAGLTEYRVHAATVTKRFLAALPRRSPESLRPLLDEDTGKQVTPG